MTERGAEQTEKPTYRSYSSIPIEQASGPNAAQRERERQGQRQGWQEQRCVKRQESQRENWLGNRARNHRSDGGCDLEEEKEAETCAAC